MKKTVGYIILLVFLWPLLAYDKNEVNSMVQHIDNQLNISVTMASNKAKSIREQAGVIKVIMCTDIFFYV